MLDPKRTALLLIDFQRFWIDGRSQKPLQRIGRFLTTAVTMGVKPYWIGHEIGPAFDQPRDLQSPDTINDMEHRVALPQRIITGAAPQTGTIIGKIESDAFTNPLLAEDLNWSGIETVLGCGYVAGQCVAVTLESGRKLGFNIGLITTLSADNLPDGGFCDLSDWWIKKHDITLITASQAVRLLRQGQKFAHKQLAP